MCGTRNSTQEGSSDVSNTFSVTRRLKSTNEPWQGKDNEVGELVVDRLMSSDSITSDFLKTDGTCVHDDQSRNTGRK